MREQGVRLEWHPAIKALGWVSDWTLSAFCAAVVVEFLATTRSGLFAVPMRLVARGGVALAVVIASVPLLFGGELWWKLVQHARREYERSIARRIIRFASSVIAVVAGLYAAVVFWLLRRLWRVLEPWSERFGTVSIGPRKAGWMIFLLLVVVSAFLAILAALDVYATVRNYVHCLRVLGTRRVIRGIAVMILLRARQPRRDFFMQAPLVSDVRLLAIAVVAYAFIPSASFAVAVASLIVLIDAATSLDRIRPPTWLFLGSSHFDAFAAFYNLRRSWGVTAVTLLDRTGDEGFSFYDAERAHGSLPKGLLYDPTVPRVWSLRTRPDMWEHTVLLLIDYVARVVVDVREMSEYVREELRWLAEPGRIEKAWFIANDDGLVPELAAMIPPSAHRRVVTEEVLTRIAAPGPDRTPRA